ncbi:ABC-type dipeptide/oligopeptide/nickel transport system ATPase component [Labedella gwakjiensis]|uniref:ABC-type dipeptide/oligopeptide/nickel transport system ATPase component n=1 Tax=Labedella gwakjiensis TaxID=390269 RepID=A0A2P8H090_9MICO|nr:ABC-type dipeptide/oligopeptide/nickel transport system ATPase component [Labedella gwakjiensis]RUQ86001.1 ATP-binding cassette domain-containing protein [Labedella gwakjiensis]
MERVTPSSPDLRAIVVDDVSVDFPAHGISGAHRAVDGVSLSVDWGDVVAIMGESGSGKSSLLRVLAADHLRPSGQNTVPQIVGGEARVNGSSVRRLRRRDLPRFDFDVAFLRQDAADTLDSERTAAEIVAAPILERDRRYNRKSLDMRVATLMDELMLPLGAMGKYPFELSSGQRQRVALARALALDPKILIADEPTAGIDISVRSAVSDLVDRRRQAGEFAAVFVTHDIDLVRALRGSVFALHSGSVVGVGTVDGLLESAEHPYLTALAHAIGPSRRRPGRTIGGSIT